MTSPVSGRVNWNRNFTPDQKAHVIKSIKNNPKQLVCESVTRLDFPRRRDPRPAEAERLSLRSRGRYVALAAIPARVYRAYTAV